MKKVSKDQIDKFFESKKLAIAGVSRNEKKFGYTVFKELRAKNYEVIPINPKADTISNIKCCNKVEDLPNDVKSLLIVTPKQQTDAILLAAIKKGINNIWIQQTSETNKSLQIAEEHKKPIITSKCIFMFTQPVKGIHKFHREFANLFGKLPK